MSEPGDEPAKDVFDDEFADGEMTLLSGSERDNVLENFEEVGSRADRRNTSDKKVVESLAAAAGLPIDAGATDKDTMVDVLPALNEYLRDIEGRRRSEGQQDVNLMHVMSDEREQEALVSPEAFQEAQDQDDLNIFAEIPDHCLCRGSSIRESGGRRSTARSPRGTNGSRVSGRHTGRYTQDQLEQVNYKRVSGNGTSQRHSAGLRASGNERISVPERLSIKELNKATHGEPHSFENEQDGILFELPASEYKDNSRRRAGRNPPGSGARGSGSSSSSAPAPSPMAPRVPQKRPVAQREPDPPTPSAAIGGRLDTIQSFVGLDCLDTKLSPSHSTQSFPEPDADLKELYESGPGARSKASTLGSLPQGIEDRKFLSRDDESDEPLDDTGRITETLTIESFSESQAYALDREPRDSYTRDDEVKIKPSASTVKQMPKQRPRPPKAPASAVALDGSNSALGRDIDPLSCSEDGAPPTKEAFEPAVAAIAGEDSSAHARVPASPNDNDSTLPTRSSTVERGITPRSSSEKEEDAAVEQEMLIRPPDSNRCASHGNIKVDTETEGSGVAGVPSKDTCSPLTRRIRALGSIRSAN